MVILKRLPKYVDISNQNMEARLLQLELSMEHAQRDLEELKELMIKLSHLINNLQIQINDLVDSK